MGELREGTGDQVAEHHVQMIESGGEVQEPGLPDRGRIVIERIGVTVEGTTSAIVFAIAVAGTVGSAAVAVRPGGVVPGVCAMGTITVLISIYYTTSGRRRRR